MHTKGFSGRDKKLKTCVLLLLVLVLQADVSVEGWLTFSTNGRQPVTDDKQEHNRTGYPFHDATVASGYLFGSLSLPEIEEVHDCVLVNDTERAQFKEDIPRIITTALARAPRDRGRIVEYTNQAVDIADNYEGRIRGVTLVGIALANLKNDMSLRSQPACYAAHLITSSFDVSQQKADPRAYNVSVLLEADVFEYAGEGVQFAPRKYCFDLDDDSLDSGSSGLGILVQEPSSGTAALWSKLPRDHMIVLGTKQATITSHVNRVTWVATRSAKEMTPNELMRNSYRTPKVELLALHDALGRGNCTTHDECVAMVSTALNRSDVDWDRQAMHSAVSQHMWMKKVLDDWKSAKAETRISDGDLDYPFIFDSRIATKKKNGQLPLVQVNPFYSKEEIGEGIGTTQEEANVTDVCIKSPGDSSDQTWTSASNGLLYYFLSAFKRRLLEHSGVPKKDIKSWGQYYSKYKDILSFPGNRRYLEQNVTWGANGQAKRGNVTDKQAGRTADYVLMSDYGDSHMVQDIWSAQQQTRAYRDASFDATDNDHPCSHVASSMEVYLLAIGMLAAAGGGVNAIVSSIHHFFRYATPISSRIRDSLATRGCRCPSQWRKYFPTYEMSLCLVGMILFASLYITSFQQVKTEFDIYRFRTFATAMEVNYAPEYPPETYVEKPLMITLVDMETRCSKANPWRLLSISLFMFLLSIVINLPHIHMGGKAFQRYFRRVLNDEERVPPFTSVYDNELRILDPRLDLDNNVARNDAEKSEEELERMADLTNASVDVDEVEIELT